jgi:peptidoglycan/LPS O-acetylase OafA/YrhL
VKSLGEALLRPGFLRLFLASTVVLQHARICALGSWAVEIFFVLSGYWVSRMWWERYRQRPNALAVFFTSRFWRLWPVYVVCQLIGLAVLARFSPRWSSEVATMAQPEWILRALAIVSAGSQFVLVPPIWSLDIEMRFYLCLPLLAWACARIFKLSAGARNILLTVIFVGLGGWFAWQVPGNPDVHILSSHLIFFGLGMVTFFSQWQPTLRTGLGSAGLVTVILAIMVAHPGWRHLLGPDATRTALADLKSANALLCGGLAVLAAPYAAFTVTLPSPGLDRHLGNISYVLYLFHYPLQQTMDWAGPSLSASPAVRAIVQLVVLVGGTIALYRCVDLPSEHWRHAIFERRRGLPAAENAIRP